MQQLFRNRMWSNSNPQTSSPTFGAADAARLAAYGWRRLMLCGAAWGMAFSLMPSQTVQAAVNPPIRIVSPPPQVLPRIDSFAPLSGQIGSRVTIIGQNLGNTTSVKFNNVFATTFTKTTNSVTAVVPAGATSGVITIATNTDDTARTNSDFNVVATRVASFSPISGPPDTIVSISGTGLQNTSAVKFGNVSVPPLFKNEFQVTAKVPATAPTSDFITVVTPLGSPKTDRPFGLVQRTVAPPSIATFAPTAGVIGTEVIINGANFSDASSVKFNGITANYEVLSATQIRALVPSGAATGRITVTRGTATATSATNFSVTVSTAKSIMGRIVNGTIGMANVRVLRAFNNQFSETLTDSRGNYAFANVPAGEHIIIPVQRGTIFLSTRNTAGALATVTTSSVPGVNFTARTVPGAFSISGKLLNRAGQPMPGNMVVAAQLNTARNQYEFVAGSMTDSSGNYSFSNLPAGLYFIFPFKTNYTFGALPAKTASTIVQNLSANSTGNNFQVLSAATPPANDNFSSAQSLSGTVGRVVANNSAGTKQIGEPNHANVPSGQSLWYRWTAPNNGLLTVNTAGSLNGTRPTDTLLAAYTGTSVSALTPIGANNDVSTTDVTSRIVINVVAGRTYYLAVDTPYYFFGGIVLNWSFSASVTPTPTPSTAPANDMFARAQLIAGASGRVVGRNSGATREAGEPVHHVSAGGRTVWYKWVAPGNGTVTFTTVGSRFDTIMAVYSGTALNALTPIGVNDDEASTIGTSKLAFVATAARTYYIAIDGYRLAAGELTLGWNFIADRGPANDDWIRAQVLSGTTGRVTGNNTEADKEAGEPAHNGNSGGKSLWYKWTAPATGTATFDTIGSTFDTLLAVYTGTGVSALTRIASDDDSGGNRTSRVNLTVVAGTTYTIAVDGYNGAAGTVVLNFRATSVSGPPNDAFANAQIISGPSGRVTGTTVNATRESGEPLLSTLSSGKSIWYSWTAPSAGTASFNTVGSGFDTILGIFTGTGVGTLNRIAVDDDGADVASVVNFVAVAGQTYRILVADGATNATGNVVLTWSLTTGTTGSSDLQIFAPWTWEIAGSTLTLGVEEIFNNSATRASNNVRLELWAFPSRFTGNENGYQLGAVNVGILGPKQSITEFEGSTAVRLPPSGIYYITLFVTEQDSSGYSYTDYLDDDFNPYDFTGGGTVALTRQAPSTPAKPSGNPSTANSAVVLSSTVAQRDGSLALTFTGALADDAGARFTVTVNGVATAIESTFLDAGNTRVTLQLDQTLNSGQKVDVTWQQLRDAQGRTLRAGSTSAVVR
jgi:hypothetical protein